MALDPALFILPVLALAIAVFIFWRYYKKTERVINELNQKLLDSEQQLKVAEESFYTRKMGQQVFENILHYYKAQMVDLELKISQLQNQQQPADIGEKLKFLGAKIRHPTKAKFHRLEKLLNEAEHMVAEINFLHNKLLKHEIDEELFNFLSEEKHKKIISAEVNIRRLTKGRETPPETPRAPKEKELGEEAP